MLELVINIVGFVLLALAIWVFIDATRNKVEKRMKWALQMLINPFAIRRYLKARNSKQALDI